jgi:vitamin B12 transporter
MSRTLVSILLLVSVALSGAPAARADETIVVHGDPPRGGLDDLHGDAADARDRRGALAEPPFVTRIHVDERAAEAATLAEVVAASVGTHVRSLGGLGGFSSISVRGAASGHTQVIVDGVPLSKVASVTADLGRLELASFAEVELYRGGVPAALGGAALGGALSLATRTGRGAAGERVWLSAGAGSFGARHLRARWGDGDPVDGLAATAGLGYASADGDFVYFDDGGTNLDPEDDGWRVRRNNGYEHLDLAARVAAPSWSAGLRGLVRRQGLPGSATAPAERARLDTASVAADAGARTDTSSGAVELRGWTLVEAQRYLDHDAEIGLGAEDRRYLTVATGATAGAVVSRGRHRATAAIDGRVDWFRDVDVMGGGDRVRGARLAGAAALSDDVALAGGRWVIEPAVRLDVLFTDPIVDRYVPGMPEAPVRTDVAPSPRVSTRALVTGDVAFKASAGWYFRTPTLAELYGDRGFLVGSPDLHAERGPSVDAGWVVAPAGRHGPVDRVLIEAAGFASWPRDTIALVSTGALVARPLNVGDARLAGVEATATARLARAVTVAGNYTFLASEQRSATPSYDRKPLPQRPRHSVYTRVDVAREVRARTAVAWADAAWIGGNYLDQAALNRVPARRLVGAGLKLELGAGVTLGVEVKNLLDARIEHVRLDPAPRPDLAEVPRAVADVAGYPLPGRAVYVAVEWQR